ncbi:metalloregulator ArsR/SmtB family transcription factor [Magnetococcus sp. PR-3]|uniref:metalloregulator ArsR/SmtB family transcription factor n=1 Tax=Magnetococcus sp. PR-3 TaxID=3120355 RepID=UPI002FCE3621
MSDLLIPETVLKMLVDGIRLRALMLLLAEGELCVCEISHGLDIIQPKISRNLTLLKNSQLIQGRREGKWIYYQIHPQLPLWAIDLLKAVHQGLAIDSPHHEDRKRLDVMENRPNRCSSDGQCG